MATLTVLKFSQPNGAETAEAKLLMLKQQQLIYLNDAAIVSWKWGKERPETRQTISTHGFDAVDGAFWGLLFGLIFFVPLLGADSVSNDPFIQAVQAQVTEGTSALFTLTREAIDDRIVAAFGNEKLEVIAVSLNAETQKPLCGMAENRAF
jgi:uncharacterized membrane protein